MQPWLQSWRTHTKKGTRKQRQTKSLVVEERGGASFGVEIKPQKADIVKITDSVGGCMIITINATGDVINALSGEILDREGAMV